MVAVIFALIGQVIISSGAASPYLSIEPEAGSGNNITVGSDVAASGGQYIQFASEAFEPPDDATYPSPNSVGYKAENCPGGTVVVDSPAKAPAGTHYNDNYLTVTGSNVTLNCLHIKRGLYIEGDGTLTLTNSIVEGATWFIVYIPNASTDRIIVADSTLRWGNGSSTNTDPGSGAGVIQVSKNLHGSQVLRSDLSGNPDGIQVAGDDWLISGNWIHNLARIGAYPNNTHNDGIQVYNGANIRILNNRIELDGFDGTHQNATVFFQVTTAPNPQIIGNFLEGGGVVLRLEGGATNAIIKDNVFGPLDHSVAEWPYYYYATNGASIAEWSNNCKGDLAGNRFEPCQAVN